MTDTDSPPGREARWGGGRRSGKTANRREHNGACDRLTRGCGSQEGKLVFPPKNMLERESELLTVVSVTRDTLSMVILPRQEGPGVVAGSRPVVCDSWLQRGMMQIK